MTVYKMTVNKMTVYENDVWKNNIDGMTVIRINGEIPVDKMALDRMPVDRKACFPCHKNKHI